MIIQGVLGKYDCRYTRIGYTYAEVVLYKHEEITTSFFGLFKRTKILKKKVWSTDSSGWNGTLRYDRMGKMLPDELRKHFVAAVDEYEKYTIAWDKEIDVQMSAVENENLLSSTRRKR